MKNHIFRNGVLHRQLLYETHAEEGNSINNETPCEDLAENSAELYLAKIKEMQLILNEVYCDVGRSELHFQSENVEL